MLAVPKTPSARDLVRGMVDSGKYRSFVRSIQADPCAAAEKIFRPAADPNRQRPFLWRGADPQHPGQAEVLEAIFKAGRSRFIAVATGHGVGKTFLVKLIPVLWLITHYNGTVILSAQSWEALRNEIIPGMRAAMMAAPWPLHPYPRAEGLFWGDEWYCVAISPLHPESAQGKHSAGGVLVLVDEASHLDPPIFNAMLSNCTADGDCMVLMGNPLRSDGAYADIILGRTGVGAETCTIARDDGSTITISMNRWNRLHISSLDSPNLRACTVRLPHETRIFPSRAEADSFLLLQTPDSRLRTVVEDGAEVYPGLMGAAGLAGMIDRYGVDTPEYQARVLGIVPDQDPNVYIARSAVEACGRRPTCPWEEDGNLTLGVDVARSKAGDQSVLIVRGDHTLHHFEAHRGLDETAVLRRILDVRERYAGESKRSRGHQALLKELSDLEADEKRLSPKKKAALDDLLNRLHLALNEDRSSAIPETAVHVDGTGLGSGLCDRLERLGYPPSVRVIAAGAAEDALGCANRRAESWKNMKKGLETLAIPEPLLRNLMNVATLRYHYDVKNRLLIESKEDYKERNERSPDEADALALTYYREPGAAAFSAASESVHALHRSPTVRPGFQTAPHGQRATFYLSLEGEPGERPGYLCRALWLARREKSACVWIHVDRDGYWAVFDSLSADNLTARIFWNRVLDKSLGHKYRLDVFSCPEGAERQGELSLEDELWAITRRGTKRPVRETNRANPETQPPVREKNLANPETQPAIRNPKSQIGAPVPRFVPCAHLAGTAGLETLDSLFLATLSYYPSNPYWKDHNLNPLEFRSDKRIGIWPREVLEAVTRARLTEHGWRDETQTEDPEALVEAGGPLVRCLRLLAISGAGG